MNKNSIYISFLGVIALLLAGCYSSVPNHREALNLKGEVRWISEKIYEPFLEDTVWELNVPYNRYREVEFAQSGNFQVIQLFKDEAVMVESSIFDYKYRKLIAQRQLNADRETIGFTTYDYPIKGVIIAKEFSTDSILKTTTVQQYKGCKLIVQKMTFVDQQNAIEWAFCYDENDNVIKENITLEPSGIVANKYYQYLEYDTKGNWTKRLLFEYDTVFPEEVQVRAITYY